MEEISNPADFGAIVFRLVMATVVGAALGINREFRKKPAGLRTHALVSLGAALLAMLGLKMSLSLASGELNALSRVVQGIVVGVGFIGGGAILRRERAHTVEGLSTAASIWVVAAAGTATGAGLWRSALVTTGLALLLLIGGKPVDRAIRDRAGDKPAG